MPTCYVQFYCCHCTYVIHDNKIIFIVIVIVIVIVNQKPQNYQNLFYKPVYPMHSNLK